MEWKFPSKSSMTYYSGLYHHVFPTLMLNCWGSPVNKVRNLLTSLWCQNWWLTSGERIWWRRVTCPFMWILGLTIGQIIYMSLCWLVYTCPCWMFWLGNLDAQYWFWKWRGSCVWCRKKKTRPHGIVLRQFITLSWRLSGYQMVLCGSCYIKGT